MTDKLKQEDKRLVEALEAKLQRKLTISEIEQVCAFPKGFKVRK